MNDKTAKNISLQTHDLSKSFSRGGSEDILILDRINLTMYDREIIAILGKSGAGKTMLLRLLSGLVQQSKGSITYKGETIKGTSNFMGIVFQDFCLIPWLTVLQNVEMGLDGLRIHPKERKKRAMQSIDMIGLDGFENAYPKELSGGMKQRVGVARAIASRPEILLMDEPFSALDALTAEHLQDDILEIWETDAGINNIIVVTHDIREAVLFADRIVILGNNPGVIQSIVQVDSPRQLGAHAKQTQKLVDDIYRRMTSAQLFKQTARLQNKAPLLSYRIPDVEISEFTGLLIELRNYSQSFSRPSFNAIAEYLHLSLDDILPSMEILSLFGMIEVKDDSVSLTQRGIDFEDASIEQRKGIFSELLMDNIALAKHIIQNLSDHATLTRSDIMDDIRDYFSENESKRIFKVIVEWMRYAELIQYDAQKKLVSLDELEDDAQKE